MPKQSSFLSVTHTGVSSWRDSFPEEVKSWASEIVSILEAVEAEVS
jgi:hypothetical protein